MKIENDDPKSNFRNIFLGIFRFTYIRFSTYCTNMYTQLQKGTLKMYTNLTILEWKYLLSQFQNWQQWNKSASKINT
jgi:hypothetical protein